MSELQHLIKPRAIPADRVVIEANAAERSALSKRFGLPSIDQLQAQIVLEPDGDAIKASGTLHASFQQLCAVSAEEFPVRVEEELAFRFIAGKKVASGAGESEGAPLESGAALGTETGAATAAETGIEIELSENDCDEIEYTGDRFDLGEAVAQSLGLAIDPYATGPDADATREKAGIKGDDAPSGALAEALAGLKTQT